MPARTVSEVGDHGQRRASFKQARSREKKAALVQAALALWRANGYSSTTVADICRAAGVSKALFYFYFPRKEDVLFELGIGSTQVANAAAHELLRKPYEMSAVIEAALSTLERSMRRNPPELIIEVILEGYRQELRLLAEGTQIEGAPEVFTELFTRARDDGVLPQHVDVARLGALAQSVVTEGARHWAAGAFGTRSFTEVVSTDIERLVAGFIHR